MIDSIVTL